MTPPSASGSEPSLRIRPATPDDAALVLRFIRSLAGYEKLADQVTATEDDLRRALSGPGAAAEALIGELDGRPAGFALFFHHFSTFLGRRGLYLEDLYVEPDHRGRGLGAALLRRLAALAVERGCGRFEWSVLDWNAPAIDFYRALGAEPVEGWTVFRVTGDALAKLAGKGGHV